MDLAQVSVIIGVVSLVTTVASCALAIIAAIKTSGQARTWCVVAAALTLPPVLVGFAIQGSLSHLGHGGLVVQSVIVNLVNLVAWGCLCVAVITTAAQAKRSASSGHATLTQPGPFAQPGPFTQPGSASQNPS